MAWPDKQGDKNLSIVDEDETVAERHARRQALRDKLTYVDYEMLSWPVSNECLIGAIREICHVLDEILQETRR